MGVGEPLLAVLGPTKGEATEVIVDLMSAAGFMRWDNQIDGLVIEQGATQEENVGRHMIKIVVSGEDQKGDQSEQSYKIKLTIRPTIIETS